MKPRSNGTTNGHKPPAPVPAIHALPDATLLRRARGQLAWVRSVSRKLVANVNELARRHGPQREEAESLAWDRFVTARLKVDVATLLALEEMLELLDAEPVPQRPAWVPKQAPASFRVPDFDEWGEDDD